MELTIDQTRKLKGTRILLTSGVLLGLLYASLSHGFQSFRFFAIGGSIGLLIGLNVAFLEFIVFEGSMRRLNFTLLFLLRIFAYLFSTTIIILFILILFRMFRFDLNFHAVLQSQEFRNYLQTRDYISANLYALALNIIVNFTLQMNRKMGQGVLAGFILGQYYKPHQTEMFIMFIKVRNAKKIVDILGRLDYHRYLNEVIFDLTDIAINRKANIHEYVEEDIVLVWNLTKGRENANCIRIYFEMKDKISTRKEYYFEKYRIIPKLKASLHFGKVIQGEIGDIKSDIKYHGDTMNTVSRILGVANDEDDFLASEEAIAKLELPVIYDSTEKGPVKLKGKARQVNLYSLKEKVLN